MYAHFEACFTRDLALSCHGSEPLVAHAGQLESQLSAFLRRFGGASFNNGLYRVLTAEAPDSAGSLIAVGFPGFSRQVRAFAFDWLGRIFALDPAGLEDGSGAVVMFEPGTGVALDIPCNLATFHDNELVNHAEEALAVKFFGEWLATGGAAPSHDQCVGYKKPLFLGGEDVIENLELSNRDVY